MKLFTPVNIGKVEIKNRIVMAPMGHGLAHDGCVTDAMIEYFVARAKGGVGLIITGGTWVVPCSGGSPATTTHPNLYDDRFIPGFLKLTEKVHKHGAKIACQLSHLGRQLTSEEFGRQPVAPSPIPCPVCRETPKELSKEEIAEIVEAHAMAVKRARSAGFDMVEFQGCHGYLISEFLSPHANQRTDEYGGQVNNRAKFYVEIVKKSKEIAGNDFPIICRYNGEDFIQGGLNLDEAKVVGKLLQKAGTDALHITASVYGSYIPTVPMSQPFGCFVYLASAIKEVVNIPVIGVGKICEPILPETVIRNKHTDLVALGRALIADPEWANKVKEGKFDEIRKCIHCNQGCVDHISEMQWQGIPLKISCMVNPECGRESKVDIKATRNPKRILVIGGGPAGLKAATVAARRGHKVSLYEKDIQLGGQFQLSSISPTKHERIELVNSLKKEAQELNVQINVGKEVNLELVDNITPDAVIIATGAEPIVPMIKGIKRRNVVAALDVLAGRAPVGMNVLIIGGGSVGLETADYLAAKGKKVKVIEMSKSFARDSGRIARYELRGRLQKHGVELVKECRLERIDHENIIVSVGGKEKIIGMSCTGDIDTVVLAIGSKPKNNLVTEIKKKVKDIYVIGDALKCRNAFDAIREGYEIGSKI